MNKELGNPLQIIRGESPPLPQIECGKVIEIVGKLPNTTQIEALVALLHLADDETAHTEACRNHCFAKLEELKSIAFVDIED